MKFNVSAKQLGINTSRLVKTKFLGHRKSAFKGEGISFADIRAYTWGDPWKKIDWRTTAKKGELHVKENEEERQLTIVIAQDCGKSMSFGLKDRNKSDVCTDIESALAYAAASYGDRWGSLHFDQSAVQWFPPKKSMRQYFHAHYEREQYHSSHDHSDIDTAIQFFLNNKVRHALIFLLCDDFVESSPGLRALTHFNDVVFIHCFDEYERSLSTEKAYGLLGAEKSRTVWFTNSTKQTYQQNFEKKREATQQYIERQGASYWMITTQDDVVLSLAQFFMKKAQIQH